MKKGDYIKLGMAVNSLVIVSQGVAKYTTLRTVMVFFVAILIAVALVPVCRGYENMWVFLLVFGCSVPFNMKLVLEFSELGFLELTQYEVGNTVILIEAYFFLVILEELIMGIAARMIWREQREILQ